MNLKFKVGDKVQFGNNGVLGDKFVILNIGIYNLPSTSYPKYQVRRLTEPFDESIFILRPNWTIHHIENALQKLKERYETKI